MRRRGLARVSLGLLGALLAAPLPATAADGTGFTLSLGGGLAAGGLDWHARTGFTLYAEAARIDASHEAGSGPAFQAALGFRFSRRLGLTTVFAWSRRETAASIDASLPHPLYLDRPRSLQAEVDGLHHSELATHFDLEWRHVGGRVEATVFAGLTLLRAETDLVQRVEVNEEYPYDEVSLRSAAAASIRSDAALGWNAGGSLGLAIAARLVFGVEARFAQARVELSPAGSESFRIDAGGLQAVAFLRLRF